jgi:hydrogenase-4 component E
MGVWLEVALILTILSDLALLGSGRISRCIRLVCAQGAIMGVMPLLLSEGPLTAHVVLLSLAFLAVKAVALPWMLLRTLRKVHVRAWVEPYLGYNLSVLAGVCGILIALWLQSRLELPANPLFGAVLPAAFTTILTGLIVVVTRRKALTQIIGYLVMENGIYLLGAPLAGHDAMWLELSILLDVFVGVFVMGIAIHHINRAFDSIDVERFATLRD